MPYWLQSHFLVIIKKLEKLSNGNVLLVNLKM